jgi:hypothetical protein
MTEDIKDLYGPVVPKDPSLFDDQWFVEIDDEWETHEGVAFTATVSRGETFFVVEQEGNGGANTYLVADEDSEQLFKTFKELSEKAYEGAFEPEALAIIWLEIRHLF